MVVGQALHKLFCVGFRGILLPCRRACLSSLFAHHWVESFFSFTLPLFKFSCCKVSPLREVE